MLYMATFTINIPTKRWEGQSPHLVMFFSRHSAGLCWPIYPSEIKGSWKIYHIYIYYITYHILYASGRSAQVGYEESLESIGQGGVFNAS
jgi:hypothetical protein